MYYMLFFLDRLYILYLHIALLHAYCFILSIPLIIPTASSLLFACDYLLPLHVLLVLRTLCCRHVSFRQALSQALSAQQPHARGLSTFS